MRNGYRAGRFEGRYRMCQTSKPRVENSDVHPETYILEKIGVVTRQYSASIITFMPTLTSMLLVDAVCLPYVVGRRCG